MASQSSQFHRHSIRIPGYDYRQPGAYFVTIVTYNRESIFGGVNNGEIKLNILGEIALSEWFESSFHRRYISLFPDECIIMPNHIHGIIWIDEIDDDNSRGAATLRPYHDNRQSITPKNVSPKSLGAIIRAYKSAVSNRINSYRNTVGSPVWQRNYFEHIVRNQAELDDIARYIMANPDHWTDDPHNPNHLSSKGNP